MRTGAIIVLACLLVAGDAIAGRKTLQEMAKEIDSVVREVHGVFAVAFKDLRSGKTYFRNGREVFQAASTIKTPVMIEVFNEARRGKFSLDDSLVVNNSFTSIADGSSYSLNAVSDSDDSLYSDVGKRLPIRKLVFDMITVSSNLAADNLIEFVGAKNIQRTMETLGMNGIRILRGVEDTRAYEAGKNNTVTAYALERLLEKLAKKKLVSRDASARMLEILSSQKFNDMIPALLPKSVRVAHKTGSSPGIEHDSAIITLPNGRTYVLVVLSKDLRDAKLGIAVIARVSKIVYDYEAN
ncbi:MAG TPA: serine hydrolase [Bacteroidota bacterium]|nr:serine hydrolase [Bacteroidota bacterium]